MTDIKNKADLNRDGRWRCLMVGAISGVVLTVILLMAVFTRMIADDYAFLNTHYSSPNPFKSASYFYFLENGRGGYAFALRAVNYFFHDRTTVVATLILLALLFLASFILAKVVLNNLLKKKDNFLVLASALAINSVIILSSFSLFDNYFWVTSSYVYVPGIIVTILAASLVIHLNYKKSISKYHLAGLFGLIVLGSFFNELTDIFLVGLFALALIGVGLAKLFKIWPVTSLRKIRLSTLWTGLAASICGFILIYISPGSVNRRAYTGSQFDFARALNDLFSNFQGMFYILSPRRLIFILLVGIFLAFLLPKLKDRKKVGLALSLMVVFMVAGTAVFFIAMSMAASGYKAMRTYLIPASIFSLMLVIVAAMVSRLIIDKVGNNLSSKISLGIMALLLIIELPLLFINFKPTLKALVIRQEAFDARAISVKQQLKSNRKVITLKPLPVLLKNTESQDFAYNGREEEWLRKQFRIYYGIPKSSRLTLLRQGDYCVNDPNNTPYYVGAKTCFDASHQSQRRLIRIMPKAVL